MIAARMWGSTALCSSIQAALGCNASPASPSIPNGRSANQSSVRPPLTLAEFPANSLLFVENSLLGIQKFPAPLRREFRCKPMDSLAEWRRKLANEPKIFKNSLQIPGVHPCGETQKLGTGCDGSRRGL